MTCRRDQAERSDLPGQPQPDKMIRSGFEAGRTLGATRIPRAASAPRTPVFRADLLAVFSWYFHTIYGVHEGPGVLPFYCDPGRVGSFAVSPDDLAVGHSDALFRLFVTLTMFQGFRDVVIFRRQRELASATVHSLANEGAVKRAIASNGCPTLTDPSGFDENCSVGRLEGKIDCGLRSGVPCHVKDASLAFQRMGDMGKLPTSAWLHLWRDGGPQRLLKEVCALESSPTKRAGLLVQRFARVHRVGRKLATLFVSALSTPALASGLTPWFPKIDGNGLVVVDTNVGRAVDRLRRAAAPRTYAAREAWLAKQAERLDLRAFSSGVPGYSPRLLQQALY